MSRTAVLFGAAANARPLGVLRPADREMRDSHGCVILRVCGYYGGHVRLQVDQPPGSPCQRSTKLHILLLQCLDTSLSAGTVALLKSI